MQLVKMSFPSKRTFNGSNESRRRKSVSMDNFFLPVCPPTQAAYILQLQIKIKMTTNVPAF